jgi:A/G-specific adenine glycosylase
MTQALLAWYQANSRDLPWRHTTDPYRIWVSEVMLQQTQVNTVIPYYGRFLARFPTIGALAGASLDEVLALWQGLGYYARARSLHAAARIVCEQYGGVIPTALYEFLSLPGVGHYTAGAVLSIALGQDEPAIDGNVIRVLCRLFNYEADPAQAAGKAALRRYAEALLPHGQAGMYNQAMMELGATICAPREARCTVCPLAGYCQARALGVQLLRPVIKRRGEVPERTFVAAFVAQEDASNPVPFLIVRRLPQGLLGGLWELPGGEVPPGEGHAQALAEHLRANLNLCTEVDAQVTVVKHAYTHFHLVLHVYRCRITGEAAPSGPWDSYHWLSPKEVADYALTGVTAKVLAHIKEQ